MTARGPKRPHLAQAFLTPQENSDFSELIAHLNKRAGTNIFSKAKTIRYCIAESLKRFRKA